MSQYDELETKPTYKSCDWCRSQRHAVEFSAQFFYFITQHTQHSTQLISSFFPALVLFSHLPHPVRQALRSAAGGRQRGGHELHHSGENGE